jgi:hypothetical protein
VQSHRLKIRDAEGCADGKCPPTGRSCGIEVPGEVGVGHDLVRLAPCVSGERLTAPLAWDFVNDRAHFAPSPMQRSF